MTASNSQSTLACSAPLGESRPFDELLAGLRSKLTTSAIGLCGDPQAAADLVQEALIEAWKHRERFDERCLLSTWVYGILRNCCRQWKRKQHRHPPAEANQQGEPIDEAFAPDERLVQRESHQEVSRALATLSEDHRQILELRFYHDSSLAEMSEFLTIPIGTVKSRLHHAMENLRLAYFSEPRTPL